METLKELKLRAEDFNRLDITCGGEGTGQYISITDCPICRACARAGLPGVIVQPGSVHLLDKTTIDSTNFCIDSVERCRLELLAGAEEAIIPIE